MMRLVVAVSAIALIAARPQPHASPRVVRAVVVSGDRQQARAFAAPAAATYQTEFSKPVVVSVDGPAVPKKHPRHVVFTCVTKDCVFAAVEQHELDDYTNRAKDDNDKEVTNAYDARVNNGRAGAYLIVQARVPAGTYTIRALPVANRGERAVPTWFTLRTY